MDDDKISKLKALANRAFSNPERANNEAQWRELTKYILNNQHTSFNSGIDSSIITNKGEKKTDSLYDSTAIQANQDLASAFQGTLTNPATIWSKLRFKNPELNNEREAVEWLDASNKLMHDKFNESNFNTEIAKAYQSFTSLANLILFFEPDDNNGFRFTALHVGQVAWSENKDGIVDTVYRQFTMTARQAYERWGKDCHEDLLEALQEKPDSQFRFLHIVSPRNPKEVALDKSGLAPGNKRPVESLYIDTSHHHVCEVSGYYEMPIFVSRWSLLPSEVYGRGPGHIALPDVITLNKLKKQGLESIGLQVSPPIIVQEQDYISELDFRPGGVTVVRDLNGIKQFESASRTEVLQFSIEELRDSIKSIFYLDKLLLPPRTETGEMTAFEVAQRVEQMQRVLGPVLSRLNNELLNPLIVRAFKIMLRAGLLPEPPEVVLEAGVDVEIVFVNQLARAQQIQDVNTIQQWVQGIAMIMQLDPSAVDNVNVDGIAKHTAEVLGVPQSSLREPKEVQKIREARQQQQQAMQAQEAMVNVADATSKLNQGGKNE